MQYILNCQNLVKSYCWNIKENDFLANQMNPFKEENQSTNSLLVWKTNQKFWWQIHSFYLNGSDLPTQ